MPHDGGEDGLIEKMAEDFSVSVAVKHNGTREPRDREMSK